MHFKIEEMSEGFCVRNAVPADAEAIYELMTRVYDRMEQKQYFVCDDLAYIREQLEERGQGFVICKDGQIVASLILHDPALDEDNLGRDIGLAESELMRVIHMDSAVVDPACRGMGFQKKLLLYAEERIDKTRFHYLMATVDPENLASYRSLIGIGYKEIKRKKKYGGLLRAIVQKEV